MGGGTGTGASPIVASVAKEMGILTVGIVTKPFLFEGRRRMNNAEEGIRMLREHVDSLIVIPNERLKLISDTPISLSNAFEKADDVLRLGVANLTDLINIPGYINLDFADVTSIMKDAGYAHMGVGRGTGRDRMTEAVLEAINSPLIETTINGARGVIINIFTPPDIGLTEVDEAVSLVTTAAHPDADIIFGVSFDDSLSDEARVTVIATGFESLVVAEDNRGRGASRVAVSDVSVGLPDISTPVIDIPHIMDDTAGAAGTDQATDNSDFRLTDAPPTLGGPFITTPFPQTGQPFGNSVYTPPADSLDDRARKVISDDDINDIDSILNIFKKRS